MSFGFSIGDIAALVAPTEKTYDGWRDAPKEYADVVQTLRESNRLLCHVERRFDAITEAEDDAEKQRYIGDLLRDCQSITSELRSIIKRRRKLGHWDRLRLGAGASQVNDCRNRLARRISILTPFLFSLELESIGKDIGTIPATLDRLPQVLANALPAAIGKLIDERIEDSRTARGSVMTTYGDDDDKQAYKELRRNLRHFGIKDSVVRQQRSKLVEFIRTLTHDDQVKLTDDAGHDHQVSEKQAVPNPLPTLVPQVVHIAEDTETACAKNRNTTSYRSYQASAETEDEDVPVESVVAMPSNINTATEPEIAGKDTEYLGHRIYVGHNTGDKALNESEVANTSDATQCRHGSNTDVTGRRRYQAYVETEEEDETSQTALDDFSSLSVCSGSPRQTHMGTGGRDQQNDSSPSGLDRDTLRATPDIKPDHREPKARGTVPPQYSSGVSGQTSGETKPGNHSNEARGPSAPLKPKPSSTFATCGDLEYQKCFESSSDSDSNDSMATRASCGGHCSLCDQQPKFEPEDSWEHPSVWSDSEQRSDSQADDQASKIAHTGGTDGEEDSAERYNQNPSIRKSRKSTKRTRHHENLNFPPVLPSSFSSSSAPAPVVERAAPRSNHKPQLMIEYQPLDVFRENLLTIQLQTPPGYSVHIESGRTVRTKQSLSSDQYASDTRHQYFPPLRTSDKDSEDSRHSNCYHGFPGAPLPSRAAVRCDCQVIYWTPGLQYWNPKFVDGLRSWAMDKSFWIEADGLVV